jgi:putative transposase
MPRRARREIGGGLAHVTCRTVRRLPLFLDRRDALAYLGLIDDVTRDVVRWNVLAYCLMPNHVHLVVDADVPELSLAMHRVNGFYAQRFNRIHGFTGHLFQGRYHSKPIVEDGALPGAVRYVVMNPVRAGLCARPENWRWSSYRAVIGSEWAPRFLNVDYALSPFGVQPAPARDAFRRFVEQELPQARSAGTVPGTVPIRSGRAAA